MKNNGLLLCISAFLFVCLFAVGMFIAAHKPLWGDEVFAQVENVSGISYGGIFSGRINEGNICPLFYFLQKAVCDVAGYTAPVQWVRKEYDYEDRFARTLLRLNPVFFMSLTAAAIFWFFSRYYSLYAGAYSLAVSLTSYMFWMYWAEARVYALWVFLTAAQSLFFLRLLQTKGGSRVSWEGLLVIHFLLSVTIVFALPQIAVVSLLLFIFVERRPGRYVTLWLLPSCLSLVYYLYSPRFRFVFDSTPKQLVRSSFPNNRFAVLAMCGVFLIAYLLQKKTRSFRFFKNEEMRSALPYFILTVLMLGAAYSVLFIFRLMEDRTMPGFVVSSRYFIYLMPVGVIGVTLFSVSLMRALKGRMWAQVPLAGVLAVLLLCRLKPLYSAVLAMLK